MASGLSQPYKQGRNRTAPQGGAFITGLTIWLVRSGAALATLVVVVSACGELAPTASPATATASPPTELPRSTASATIAPTRLPSPTASPTTTPTASPVPTVESLRAEVTVEGFLSCRYGPGPDYLYLDALRTGTNLVLVGRTDGDNWSWVYVQGTKNNCWVHAGFISIEGSMLSLPIVYPGSAGLPRSPYYPATVVLGVAREQDRISLHWLEVPLRAGDEEDERMQHYIVEVWRCEAGRLLFEPLATNETSITFVDQPGCSSPSHGRVFVQEKHGFAGPAEIPWPE